MNERHSPSAEQKKPRFKVVKLEDRIAPSVAPGLRPL